MSVFKKMAPKSPLNWGGAKKQNNVVSRGKQNIGANVATSSENMRKHSGKGRSGCSTCGK